MTFHRALNYGAVLQAYALQQVLKNIGKDSEIIDYRCERIEKLYAPFSAKTDRGLVQKLKKLLRWNVNLEKRKKFAAFTKRYLRLSEPYYDKAQLKAAAENYALCITGSDQVFHLGEAGGDTSYFLDFAKRKLAYAASFGSSTLQPSDKKTIAPLLRSFDAISVRESSAVALAEELSGRTVTLALDPVLLLEVKAWESIWQKPKNAPENYVLAYMMAGSDTVTEKLYRCAEENGCEPVIVNPTWKQTLKNRDCRQYAAASPEAFLWLLGNARTVVTNSFHGLAFAIAFRKSFYVELSDSERADRLRDLLKLLELEDRCLPCEDPKPIDWERVERILLRQKAVSMAFLEGSGRRGTVQN